MSMDSQNKKRVRAKKLNVTNKSEKHDKIQILLNIIERENTQAIVLLDENMALVGKMKSLRKAITHAKDSRKFLGLRFNNIIDLYENGISEKIKVNKIKSENLKIDTDLQISELIETRDVDIGEITSVSVIDRLKQVKKYGSVQNDVILRGITLSYIIRNITYYEHEPDYVDFETLSNERMLRLIYDENIKHYRKICRHNIYFYSVHNCYDKHDNLLECCISQYNTDDRDEPDEYPYVFGVPVSKIVYGVDMYDINSKVCCCIPLVVAE